MPQTLILSPLKLTESPHCTQLPLHSGSCVRLHAGIAPNITAGPTDSTVIDGMSVILHCETSGAPRPAITWQKGTDNTHNHTVGDYDVPYLLNMGPEVVMAS